MRRVWLVALVLLAPSFRAHDVDAQATTELRIATVAPEGSPWLRVFRAWDQELRQRTEGRVGLRLYAGGSQGQESDYLDKMSAGQLDGAALTSTGLSQIVRPVLVLGLPGIFDDYATLDRVRRRLSPRFERELDRAGYALLGWGDVGKGRLFSTQRIERPSDLRRARPWAPREDAIFSEFLDVVGAQPRRLGIPEVYPALQTGMVDTVPASALAAVALQWHTRLRFYSRDSAGILIGATVIRKERLDALRPEDREVLLETSRRGHQLVARAIRREDERALGVIAQRMTAVDTTAHETEWRLAALQTRDRLVGRVFPQALFDAVVRAALE
ncbi:MAG: TRAP transporter substrate-binding protein DctP [Sandaracinus sp.]|nr:TRAP transporter substrate-binding protein DctP [Sandaracinus sp.]